MTARTNPTCSKDSRVQPIFGWLRENAGIDWPERLLKLAHGLGVRIECGRVERVFLDPERKISPTPARLAWMLRNVKSLVPVDGREWQAAERRVGACKDLDGVLAKLDGGDGAGLGKLCLEGETHADCFIECERVLIWIEGKRFDWLSPSTKFDVSRDQLARNVEAVWSLAATVRKEYCVLICHEHHLKHHEQCLVNGYRTGMWSAGWPHIPEAQRTEFSRRIGTVTWKQIAETWPDLNRLPELKDLE